MSVQDDPLKRAIDDARALLDTLLSSGWQDLHIVSGDSEIFIARDGGRPNPMRQAATPQPVPAADVAPPPSEPVTAPHVATIVDIVAVGTVVESGDRIATIRVLDREEVVAAPRSGAVVAIHADVGALVEFKMPIASLGGGAR